MNKSNIDDTFDSNFNNGKKPKTVGDYIASAEGGLNEVHKKANLATVYGGYNPVTSTIETAVVPAPAPAPAPKRRTRATPATAAKKDTTTAAAKKANNASPDVDPDALAAAQRKRKKYEELYAERYPDEPRPDVSKVDAFEACAIYQEDLNNRATPYVLDKSLLLLVAQAEDYSNKHPAFRQKIGADIRGVTLRVQQELALKDALAFDLKELSIYRNLSLAIGPELRVIGRVLSLAVETATANAGQVSPEDVDIGDIDI